MSDLQYPIGKFEWIEPENEQQGSNNRVAYIETIAKLPGQMRSAVQGLGAEQLDTPYRPEGWSVRQVVHHVPDSHMNAYVRFKLALTEEQPEIRPYKQAEWANLPDTSITPIEVSLQLLAALHSRWVDLLQAMRASEFGRTLYHPERGILTLDYMLAMYAWHSNHHLAHISNLRERMGWRQRAAAQH